MSESWKYKLSNLNSCLEKNNMPRLKILTDRKGYVVYLDRFCKTSDMLLEFCDEDDVLKLLKNVDIVEKYYQIKNTNNIITRNAIIRDIVDSIPRKIIEFI